MSAILPKFIEPGLQPLGIFAFLWVASIYGRRKYGDEAFPRRYLGRFFVWYAALKYLEAWHQEIGTAWIQHPQLSIFGFVILLPMVIFMMMPRPASSAKA